MPRLTLPVPTNSSTDLIEVEYRRELESKNLPVPDGLSETIQWAVHECEYLCTKPVHDCLRQSGWDAFKEIVGFAKKRNESLLNGDSLDAKIQGFLTVNQAIAYNWNNGKLDFVCPLALSLYMQRSMCRYVTPPHDTDRTKPTPRAIKEFIPRHPKLIKRIESGKPYAVSYFENPKDRNKTLTDGEIAAMLTYHWRRSVTASNIATARKNLRHTFLRNR